MNVFLEDKTFRALVWIINILNVHSVPYCISGGLAGKIYGSTRDLHDIDIDIPEKYFDVILPEISEHITYGPARYLDDKWDLRLITLKYHGQEIDISGSDQMLISNKERTKWIHFPTNFDTALNLNVNNIELKIIHPSDLIAYKTELDGTHQQQDIDAAEKYIKELIHGHF